MILSKTFIPSDDKKLYSITCNIIKCQMTVIEKELFNSTKNLNSKKKCENEHPCLVQCQNQNLNDVNYSELVESSGKMIALNELLISIANKQKRIIIISKINNIIKILEAYIKFKKFNYMVYNNNVRGEKRNEIISNFNSKELDFCILLMFSDESLTGINLSMADTIIFYDNEINKEKIVQNFNIQKSTSAYHLIMNDDESQNVEETINLSISQPEQKNKIIDSMSDDFEVKPFAQIFHISLNDTKTNFPLIISDNLHILSIGSIVTKEKFHTNKYIYPSGYCAKRLLPSIKNQNKNVWYFLKIIDNGNPDPIFRIEMENDGLISFEGTEPSKVFIEFYRNFKENIVRSGPELYGLTIPIIQYFIQNLEGVDQLNKYVKKKFIIQNNKNNDADMNLARNNMRFQTRGACKYDHHYMVNIENRLKTIKIDFVDKGKYFEINQSRQCGKTTTLLELIRYLNSDYYMLYIDLINFNDEDFISETNFLKEFINQFLLSYKIDNIDQDFNLVEQLVQLKDMEKILFKDFFLIINDICMQSKKPLVLIIDEIDKFASNKDILISFLSISRGQYQRSDRIPTFKSIILSGVRNIDYLRSQIQPEKDNNPFNASWNIAADFHINMYFSIPMISSMLKQYEDLNKTGMDIPKMSSYIYEYTSGQPFLVSKICQLIDEELPKISTDIKNKNYWSKEGIVNAVNIILNREIPFFSSLFEKLDKSSNIEKILKTIVFKNNEYLSYSTYNNDIRNGKMFGFITEKDGNLAISSRILEMALIYHFITKENIQNLHGEDLNDRSKYFKGNELDMEYILNRFIFHFNQIYGNNSVEFKEENGRKIFMTYLRQILNKNGNFYIDGKRAALIVNYLGKQYLVELKINHGDAYNNKEIEQLIDYLDKIGLDVGYLLIFNLNKKKKTGVSKVEIRNKTIIKAIA